MKEIGWIWFAAFFGAIVLVCLFIPFELALHTASRRTQSKIGQ